MWANFHQLCVVQGAGLCTPVCVCSLPRGNAEVHSASGPHLSTSDALREPSFSGLEVCSAVSTARNASRGHFQGVRQVIRGNMEVTPAVGQVYVCRPCWPRVFRSNRRKQKFLCFGLLSVVVDGVDCPCCDGQSCTILSSHSFIFIFIFFHFSLYARVSIENKVFSVGWHRKPWLLSPSAELQGAPFTSLGWPHVCESVSLCG